MAAAHKPPTLKIDLIHPQGTQPKLLNRAFKWLLSSGRYIVIFAELVVIGAFVSRFKLDSDLTALQDSIKEQVPYIQSLKADEDLLRQTQFQLSTVKKIRSDTPNWQNILEKISHLTPVNTKVTNVGFDRVQKYPDTTFQINGQATSNTELAAFLKGLQNDSSFNNVSLTNLSYDRQLVIFTLSGGITNAK